MATEQRTIEKYENGVLLSSEVIDVEIDDNPETVLIPKSAITDLGNAMADPSINSIAEIKSAITSFVDRIQS